MSNRAPQTVGELFPSRYLSAAELGRPVTVKIAAVAVEEFRQPDGERHWRAVVSFERATKQLICNKTQSLSLARLCGSERVAEWVGHVVTLKPGKAPNGKQTIEIGPGPWPSVPAAPASSPPAEPAEDDNPFTGGDSEHGG